MKYFIFLIEARQEKYFKSKLLVNNIIKELASKRIVLVDKSSIIKIICLGGAIVSQN